MLCKVGSKGYVGDFMLYNTVSGYRLAKDQWGNNKKNKKINNNLQIIFLAH